jgi:hypothetical protein
MDAATATNSETPELPWLEVAYDEEARERSLRILEEVAETVSAAAMTLSKIWLNRMSELANPPPLPERTAGGDAGESLVTAAFDEMRTRFEDGLSDFRRAQDVLRNCCYKVFDLCAGSLDEDELGAWKQLGRSSRQSAA